jgi:NADPH2:quinone reductase
MAWQANVVRIHQHGGPEELRYEEVQIQEPGEGEVVVRQAAAGINFVDTYQRRGVFHFDTMPLTLGIEAAGVVEAVGSGVTRFREGDRVAYAGQPLGAYASRRIVPQRVLMHLPDAIDFRTAAAVTVQGMTCHMLMTRVRMLKPGDTVLIHAAAGGLGLLLVQWAKHLGARVLGTVGSPEKAKLAKSLGLDEAILYKETDFVAAVKDLTNGEGVDAVYEGIGGDTLQRSLGIIKPFGVAVNLGQVAGPLPTVDLRDLGPYQSLSVSVPGLSPHLRTLPDLQAAADLMFGLVVDGTLKVHIGASIPLSQTADAHRLIESGQSTGSIILEP